jgi:hypothetical protein
MEDIHSIAINTQNLAIAYRDIGKRDQAYEYAKQAYSLYLEVGDSVGANGILEEFPDVAGA